MGSEPLESGLELLVMEGGGQGRQHVLARTSIELGRFESGDTPRKSRIGFPDPTVSRIHAELIWDPAREAYTIVHHSRTNHTLVNGELVTSHCPIKPGDYVALGHLVFQVCRSLPTVQHADQHLMIWSGPERGSAIRLPTFPARLRSPGAEPPTGNEVVLEGLGELRLELRLVEGRLRLAVERCPGPPVRVVDSWAGVLRDLSLTGAGTAPVEEGCLILAGLVALSVVGAADAETLAEAFYNQEISHPLLDYLGSSTAPHPWRLRVQSGDYANSVLWLDPAQMEAPVRFGPPGPAPVAVEVPSGETGELQWTGDGPFLRNTHPSSMLSLNWDDLKPRQEARLVSGDRFQVGKTTLRLESVAMQALLDDLRLRFEDDEMPFQREVSLLGTDPASDFCVNEDLLANRHGSFRVLPDGRILYRHLDPDSRGRVGDAEVRAFEEREVAPGAAVEIAEGVTVEIVRLRKPTPEPEPAPAVEVRPTFLSPQRKLNRQRRTTQQE